MSSTIVEDRCAKFPARVVSLPEIVEKFQSKGVKKGDRVIIYMPMIVELPVAMLACARIGAIHGVIFGGIRSGPPSAGS
jgi:acetyl-CoA synthetase